MSDASTSSPSSNSPQRWTTRSLLAFTGQYLADKGVDSPRLASEMLLAHVLKCERLRLFMEMDRPASEAERNEYRSLVQRASNHEPVDYLIETAPFYGQNFKVNSNVLIPRPSTETLIDEVLSRKSEFNTPVTPKIGQIEEGQEEELQAEEKKAEAEENKAINELEDEGATTPEAAMKAIDVGTGSGIIAITLARNLPHCQVLAIDKSEAALQTARINAQSLKVDDRIEFVYGDLLSRVPDSFQSVDLIAANLPYIPDHEWSDVAPNVKDYEPHLALRGGPDGLDLIKPLINQACKYLNQGGWLMLEVASCHIETVVDLAKKAELQSVNIVNDHENLPRIVTAQKP